MEMTAQSDRQVYLVVTARMAMTASPAPSAHKESKASPGLQAQPAAAFKAHPVPMAKTAMTATRGRLV